MTNPIVGAGLVNIFFDLVIIDRNTASGKAHYTTKHRE